MVTVRNVSAGNIRVCLDVGNRFLIPAGGVKDVDLPSKVKTLAFFNDHVKSGALIIVSEVEDEDEDSEAEGEDAEKEDAPKRRGRPPKNQTEAV